VLITEVERGSAADSAGLRVGDFVSHVEDVAVETPREFHAATQGVDDEARLVRLDGSHVLVPPSPPADDPTGAADPAR
jgi:S1-C subfamily serine protease